ncbi:hypothetical protein [Litoribrevibacter albus]|uniref:Transmembrane protein n=1 Tax=Litoribrevibacter albus TaxID=1473156 RepID=A0AA37S714_9GAMM|nr:hypothetical protein [Litoribrevibacter albus]GLQ29604.1 hypothetical protein GCM10007876_00820 [Litoribrevibacter albus]
MFNRKLIIGVFVLIPCLLMVFLPIYSVVSGYLNPSLEHLERAKTLLPNSTLLQIGFSSGSYSCVNDVCDYSHTFDQRQYISVSGIDRVVTIKKSYEGKWIESSIDTTPKFWLSLIAWYAVVFVGLFFSGRELRRK